MSRKLLQFAPRLTSFKRMSSTDCNALKNVLVDTVGGITTIAINRPEKRNAVDPATAAELVTAFKHFEQNNESKVAVLHGKGGNFCAGYDLSSLASTDESTLTKLYNDGQAPMGPSRMCFSKPVIAAVEGYAVAGGLELALLCDLRVVEESTVMGVYCRRFGMYPVFYNEKGVKIVGTYKGVPLIDGGTVRLQKLIGLSRAMDLILTGRSVTGKEALEIGLANRIGATGSALGVAIQLAYSLLRYPQACMNTDRRSAYYAAYDATSMDDALQYEYKNGIEVIKEESIPGAKRFTQGIGKHGSFNPNIPGKPKL